VAALSDWALDPEIAFLNHGSYGAVPRVVLDHQTALRTRLEANPVRFLFVDLPDLLAEARHAAAAFVGADPEGFAFVPNATTGTNAVLRSLPMSSGDEILLTDHGYEACNLAAEFIAARRGARAAFAEIPVPVDDPDVIRQAILDAVTHRTRYALIDHITSPTALVLPIAQIVADLAERGVETIVDGAHAPGQIALDVAGLGAVAYTANWHKWTCAPKGSAFLWVREDMREAVRPTVISHGQGHRGADGGRYRATFDWTGTADPTAHLSVPAALEHVAALGGSWVSIMERNRAIAREWRETITDRTDLDPVAGMPLVGSMASFLVPERLRSSEDPARAARDLLVGLDRDHGVVVGMATQRGTDRVFLRVSAHLHTPPEAIERLIGALEAW
jgi:isopenicillin-N epimerase